MRGRNWPPYNSLKVMLVVRQAMIVAVIVALFAVLSFAVVDRLVVRQKIGDLMNIADTKYVHVLDLLNQGKAQSRHWSSMPSLREALAEYEDTGKPEARANLEAEVTGIRETGRLGRRHAFGLRPPVRNRFTEVMITDNRGRVVASTNKASEGADVAGTPMFKFGRERTTVVNPFRDKDGEVVFAFVVPIHAGKGEAAKFLGVLVTKVNTRLLTAIMNADLGNIIGGKLWFAGFQYRSLDLYIMNKSGRFITQSRVVKRSTVLQQKGSKLPQERGIHGGSGDRITNVGIETGAREAMDIYPNWQGVEVAGASMHIFDQGWTVVVEQRTSDAFAGLIWLERAIVIGGFLAIVLAGLLTWLSARRITDSLADMAAASVRLASGDLDVEIAPRPGDYQELAALAGSLNLLGSNLKNALRSKGRPPGDKAGEEGA